MYLQLFYELAQCRKLSDFYRDFITDFESLIEKSLFGILQIVSWNLEISTESRVITEVMGSSFEFIFEDVYHVYRACTVYLGTYCDSS